MVGKILFYLNKNLGKFFFGNPNSLYYNLYNKLYSIFIAKKNLDNFFIKKYIKSGFFKTDINSSKLCDVINNELAKQNVNNEKGFFQFEITDQIKDVIKNHINNDFNGILGKLEQYYNSKISVAQIRIRRNFHLNNIIEEVYSNNYHVDHYTYNHFKLFINLNDTDLCQGPLHIYSKENTKIFLKKNKYRNRANYKKNEIKELLHINTGKKGESLIADTTQCLHKAGYVHQGYFRDMLFITFITVPIKVADNQDFFYYEKNFSDEIWNAGSKVLKITKPKSFKKTLKLWFKYYKSRIQYN